MRVSDGMTDVVLTVGPQTSLRDTARRMIDRRVGAAVVLDEAQPGPGIITERDILRAVAESMDPDREVVGDHLKSHVVFAAPDWSLEQAAAEMVRGAFRHTIVVDHGEIVGILSMRDIMRCWTSEGATSELSATAARI